MNHLDEITLNEYLDHALDKSECDAADLHLQTCHSCRAKLSELQAVFEELDALPEVQLEHDLAPTILARLSQKMPVRVWTRAFAAQVGVAIGLMFWLALQAIPFVRVPQVDFPGLPTIEMEALVTRFLTLQLPTFDFQFPTLSYQIPAFDFQIPRLALEISTTQLIALSVSVLLLWVVGNVVLLRSRQEAR
jgi:hypothetical protein